MYSPHNGARWNDAPSGHVLAGPCPKCRRDACRHQLPSALGYVVASFNVDERGRVTDARAAVEITDADLLHFEQRFGQRYERGDVNGLPFAFAVTHVLEGPGDHHWGTVSYDRSSAIVNWYVRDARGQLVLHGAEWIGTLHANLKTALRWIRLYGAKRVKLRGREHRAYPVDNVSSRH